MTKLRLPKTTIGIMPVVLLLSNSAMAEWKAANEQVAAAAKEPRIAAVLGAVNTMG